MTYVVVPQEPTEEMENAFDYIYANWDGTSTKPLYAAMLAARPSMPDDLKAAVAIARKHMVLGPGITDCKICILSLALLKAVGEE